MTNLWTEICNLVQEAVTKTILKIKKCKKTKLSEEALQIAEERIKMQGRKGKIQTPKCRLSENSQRGKKTFSSEQYKEIEGKTRMGKIRDLFKKTGDNKGIFHARRYFI